MTCARPCRRRAAGDAYRRMYEKSMIFADSVGMLGEFEHLLMKLVR